MAESFRERKMAGFLRNGSKKGCLTIHNYLRKKSVGDSVGAPILRHQPHQQQQMKPYAQLPHSIYRKTRGLEVSPPGIFSSPFSSSRTASFSSKKNGFVGWYLGVVKSHPVLTKSITCAFIYTAADLSSQTIARPSSEPYDFVRTLRMAGYGMLIMGPSLHFWFNFVSKVLPKRDIITTLKKTVMGQTLYAPTMTVVFFSVNAALQGENGVQIIARLKRDLVPAMMNGVMYWPVCSFVTFKFIPVHLQPLVSNSFLYLWTIYITYMASLEKASTGQ